VRGAEEVHDYLQICCVVAGVGEDEDGVDVELREVAWVCVGEFLWGELFEKRDGRVLGYDVMGDDDVLEAVGGGDGFAFVSFAADDEDGAVVFFECLHGGMGLDELIGRDGCAGVEDLAKLTAAIGFEVTAAVCQEYVWNSDSQTVVAVVDLEGTMAFAN
jgi:hypothetical protein